MVAKSPKGKPRIFNSRKFCLATNFLAIKSVESLRICAVLWAHLRFLGHIVLLDCLSSCFFKTTEQDIATVGWVISSCLKKFTLYRITRIIRGIFAGHLRRHVFVQKINQFLLYSSSSTSKLNYYLPCRYWY